MLIEITEKIKIAIDTLVCFKEYNLLIEEIVGANLRASLEKNINIPSGFPRSMPLYQKTVGIACIRIHSVTDFFK